MTHDYKRNGPAALFASMSTLDGTVISMCEDRHRQQEWLNFLRVIDNLTPTGKQLHRSAFLRSRQSFDRMMSFV